jgi:hypothetical protein
MFDRPGYHCNLLTKKPPDDGSKFPISYIYSFKSTKNNLKYIIIADYHDNDIFAIKFFPRNHKFNKNKYKIITNDGDVINILKTCVDLMILLFNKYPSVSFCFMGEPIYDEISKKQENHNYNTRYRIYSNMISRLISVDKFEHIAFNDLSGYFLINKRHNDISKYEDIVKTMFFDMYPDLISF